MKRGETFMPLPRNIYIAPLVWHIASVQNFENNTRKLTHRCRLGPCWMVMSNYRPVVPTQFLSDHGPCYERDRLTSTLSFQTCSTSLIFDSTRWGYKRPRSTLLQWMLYCWWNLTTKPSRSTLDEDFLSKYTPSRLCVLSFDHHHHVEW